MCTREELEAHFQAVKEFNLVRKELTVLRKQGLGAGKAYREALSAHTNPLLLRYYAPSLYAHAMTVAFEPVQIAETPAIDQQPAQELQEATGTGAALPGGETSEPAETEDAPNGVSEVTPVSVSQVEEITPDAELEEIPTADLEIVPLSPAPDPVGVVLGQNRETQEFIRLPDSHRQSGLNIVGVAGSGKSSALENIVVTDANNGHGVFFVDIQGDSTDHILERLSEDRLADVILLEPGVENNPFGINLLAHSENGVDHDVDIGMSVIKHISGVGTEQSFWGPRLATLLRNGLYVLWYSELTLAELPILLRNKDFRAACLKNVPPEGRWVTFFFEHDFNNLSTYLQMEHSESTLNKVYQLLTIREVEYVISQQETTIDFRPIMDERKILLLKLPKHTIGEDAVTFLGTVAFTSLLEAARSRADVAIEDRPFFSVVIDEFQNFASPLFSQMLPELRKFNLSFTIAYQFLAQLDEENRGATQQLTNQMSFRVRPRDAETLAHFYAKNPPPGEPRYEYKRVISLTPVDTVVTGKPHTNPGVNQFFDVWREMVKTAHSHINEGSTPGSSTSFTNRRGATKSYFRPGREWSNRDEVEEAQAWLDKINGLLYQVMVEKKPGIVPLQLFLWRARYFELPFLDKAHDMGSAYISTTLSLSGKTISKNTLLDCGVDEDEYVNRSKPRWGRQRDYVSWLFKTVGSHGDVFEVVKSPTDEQLALYNRLWQAPDAELDKAFVAFEQETRKYIAEEIQHSIAAFREDFIFNSYHWYEPLTATDKPSMSYTSSEQKPPYYSFGQVEREMAKYQGFIREYGLEWLPIDPSSLKWVKVNDDGSFWDWRLAPGQEQAWQSLPAVKLEIDRLIAEQKPSFEQLVRDFRQVMQALVHEPIETLSPVVAEKPGSQRSIADMVNEMAQELIQLPNREAYVKLGVSGAESVKIQTLPLAPGCSPSDLETRKRTISENTLPYTTNRDDVERALQQRHASYTKGGRPQPQQQETNPKPQPIKEETQSRSTTGRVCPASGTNPSVQHPVVCTDEKTTADTYLTLLYYFSHLTLQQAVRLTGKQTSSNNERTKLNKLVKDGLVVSETMKESVSSGKNPLVYSLTPKGYKYLETGKGLSPLKKGDYTKHSYLVNELLITAILAEKTNEAIKLVGFEHEKMFRMKPIQLPNGKGVEPDGLLIFRVGHELYPIALEVDLSIETREQLLDKCQKYLQAIQGPYKERCGVDAVSIVFITPNGSGNDVARLVGIIEAALEHDKEAAPLFFVGAFDPVNIAPNEVLFASILSQPFNSDKHALIETSS
jgi:hypothetical protein